MGGPGGVRLYKPAWARITPLRSPYRVPHTPQPRGCAGKEGRRLQREWLPGIFSQWAAWHNLNCDKHQFPFSIFCDFIYLLSSFKPTSFQKQLGEGSEWFKQCSTDRAPRKQFASHCSRSVFSFQTIKQEHRSSPGLSLPPQQQPPHSERGRGDEEKAS